MTPGMPEPGKHSSFPEAFHFRHLALPLLSFPLCQLQHHHLLTSKLSWFQQMKVLLLLPGLCNRKNPLGSSFSYSTLPWDIAQSANGTGDLALIKRSSNQKRVSKKSTTCSFYLSFITLLYHSLLKSADNTYLTSPRYIYMYVCVCAYTYMCIYFPASGHKGWPGHSSLTAYKHWKHKTTWSHQGPSYWKCPTLIAVCGLWFPSRSNFLTLPCFCSCCPSQYHSSLSMMWKKKTNWTLCICTKGTVSYRKIFMLIPKQRWKLYFKHWPNLVRICLSWMVIFCTWDGITPHTGGCQLGRNLLYRNLGGTKPVEHPQCCKLTAYWAAVVNASQQTEGTIPSLWHLCHWMRSAASRFLGSPVP